jgi:quercetin dioxygenase-like cupin family protein
MHDDDEMGGDAACWAHLVDDTPAAETVNLVALAAGESDLGLRWASRGSDLNLNLLVFAHGDGVREHVNHEVEVALVGIAGEGVAIVDGREHPIAAGTLILIPAGARRATRASGERFAYLTCHRKRGGLIPAVR